MRHLKLINEWYKNPEDYLFDTPTEIPVDYTYVDEAFDILVGILCDENVINKSSNEALDIQNYVETYFDNNKEILAEIDICRSDKKRPQYCAEELYHKYFRNDNIMNYTLAKD